MANAYAQQQQVYVALQSGFKVIPTFAATDAVAFLEYSARPVESPLPRADKFGAGFQPQKGSRNVRTCSWSMSLYPVGSGAAGTPPDCGPLLRAAFGVETVNAGSSVVYSISETVAEYISVFCKDTPTSISQSILNSGVVEEVTLQVDNGYPTLSFSGSAVWEIEGASFGSLDTNGRGGLSAFPSAPSSATYSGSPPDARAGALTIGGNSIAALFKNARLSWSTGKTLGRVVWGAGGLAYAGPMDRVQRRPPQLSIEIEDDDSALMTTLLTAAEARTYQAVSMQLGLTAGLIWTITMPQMQLDPMNRTYGDAKRGRSIQLSGYPNSSSDEISISCT